MQQKKGQDVFRWAAPVVASTGYLKVFLLAVVGFSLVCTGTSSRALTPSEITFTNHSRWVVSHLWLKSADAPDWVLQPLPPDGLPPGGAAVLPDPPLGEISLRAANERQEECVIRHFRITVGSPVELLDEMIAGCQQQLLKDGAGGETYEEGPL